MSSSCSIYGLGSTAIPIKLDWNAMTYYRVDRRLFNVGDEIVTAGEYYSEFEGVAREVEDALEARRPQAKRLRTECLFVFEDEKCAKKHWSKMTNGKLYKVSIDHTEISHRGDMAQMDAMKQACELGQDMTEIAAAYWRGEHSSSPEIEIMISSAVVTAVLSTSDSERRDYFKMRLKNLT